MEFNKQTSSIRSSASEAIIDQGLRSYMLKVYNYMGSALLLTGFIALITFKFAAVTGPNGELIGLTALGNSLYNSGLAWVVMLAPLGVVFYMSFGIAKMSASKAQTVFWIFASLMGLSLSSIFIAINIDDKDNPIKDAKIQKTVCAFEALILAIPKLI